MFHVSSLLPQSDINEQQLAKKRHIGNDIVLLVFQEYGSNAYQPDSVASKYITVIVIVRCTTPEPYVYRFEEPSASVFELYMF
jgi:RAP1 GTPase activating protein 1